MLGKDLPPLKNDWTLAGLLNLVNSWIGVSVTSYNLFMLHWGNKWRNDLEESRTHCRDDRKFVVNLLFSGGKFQWQDRKAQGLWREYVESLPLGKELCEWFDISLRLAFLERIAETGLSFGSSTQTKHTAGRETEVTGWERSIIELRADAHELPGYDLTKLRAPGVSVRSLLSALK